MVQFKDGIDVTIPEQPEVCKPGCGTCNSDPNEEEPEEDICCCDPECGCCGDDITDEELVRLAITVLGIFVLFVIFSFILITDPLNIKGLLHIEHPTVILTNYNR